MPATRKHTAIIQLQKTFRRNLSFQKNLQTTSRKTNPFAHSAVPEMVGFAHVWLLSPNVADYAQSLFARLHACDYAGSEVILAQAPPKSAECDGIWVRLKRASS